MYVFEWNKQQRTRNLFWFKSEQLLFLSFYIKNGSTTKVF
jgi:hypothetical protein